MNLEYRRHNFDLQFSPKEIEGGSTNVKKTIRGSHGEMDGASITKSLTKERDNRTTNKLKTTV